ncbi:putative Ras-specific guanine nucleotide-releasing factor 2 [Blattamonas nauphoetae]|uniref:Ras-specific guanine nucleotide-releasing factor 2 n=1 Tax=Blattamonas nauphoetae TaxID=2049346 RepID=A0ABQ9Y4R9_9EUKA|nr:putative Ras-specific guanine nucleotide-releasing factor 2 [Blattamonas nauphoetae]
MKQQGGIPLPPPSLVNITSTLAIKAEQPLISLIDLVQFVKPTQLVFTLAWLLVHNDSIKTERIVYFRELKNRLASEEHRRRQQALWEWKEVEREREGVERDLMEVCDYETRDYQRKERLRAMEDATKQSEPPHLNSPREQSQVPLPPPPLDADDPFLHDFHTSRTGSEIKRKKTEVVKNEFGPPTWTTDVTPSLSQLRSSHPMDTLPSLPDDTLNQAHAVTMFVYLWVKTYQDYCFSQQDRTITSSLDSYDHFDQNGIESLHASHATKPLVHILRIDNTLEDSQPPIGSVYVDLIEGNSLEENLCSLLDLLGLYGGPEEQLRYIKEMISDKIASYNKMKNSHDQDTYQRTEVDLPNVGSDFFPHPFASASEIDPEKVSMHLTMIEDELFKQLTYAQFVDHSWVRPDKNLRSPSICKLTNNFNLVTRFVVTSILSFDTPRERGLAFDRFVEVADRMMKNNNYNGCYEMYLGLTDRNVKRLSQTKKYVKQSIETLETLFCSTGSFAHLRDTIKATSPPILPVLPIYLKDLIYAEESKPFVKSESIQSPRMNSQSPVPSSTPQLHSGSSTSDPIANPPPSPVHITTPNAITISNIAATLPSFDHPSNTPQFLPPLSMPSYFNKIICIEPCKNLFMIVDDLLQRSLSLFDNPLSLPPLPFDPSSFPYLSDSTITQRSYHLEPRKVPPTSGSSPTSISSPVSTSTQSYRTDVNSPLASHLSPLNPNLSHPRTDRKSKQKQPIAQSSTMSVERSVKALEQLFPPPFSFSNVINRGRFTDFSIDSFSQFSRLPKAILDVCPSNDVNELRLPLLLILRLSNGPKRQSTANMLPNHPIPDTMKPDITRSVSLLNYSIDFTYPFKFNGLSNSGFIPALCKHKEQNGMSKQNGKVNVIRQSLSVRALDLSYTHLPILSRFRHSTAPIDRPKQAATRLSLDDPALSGDETRRP